MAFLESGGARIGYDAEGEGPSSKPCLILLHEIGGTRETWRQVARSLSPRFRVIRYDQRGAGESSPITGPFRMETAVEDLGAVVEKLGDGGCHLAGVALGAALAVRFAVKHPAKVKSLVLACPAPGVDAARVKYLEQRAAQVEGEGMQATVESSLDNSYPAELREPETFAAYRARFLANDPKSYAAINRAFPAFDITGELGRIVCPTLVLAGTLDKLRPPAFVRGVVAKIPGARYQEIHGGHIMPVQAPQALGEAMAAFYDEQKVTEGVVKSP